MIITLYKNCRLNKSYCEVLDTIAPHTYNGVEYANSLEAYLSTLPKKVFNTGVGTIYGTNSGKIPFELAQGEGLTMYDYNYMKIADETNNFVRYCFILSLQVADGSAIAEYEEDVWASYSATMHVRKSLLTRSRALKYGNFTIPFYKLGMEYEGNDEPIISSINTSFANNSNDSKVNIIAQLQLYKLGTQGEKTTVITRTIMLVESIYQSYFTIGADLMKRLTNIIASQTSEQVLLFDDYCQANNLPATTLDDKKWYYEISNIVMIPYKFGIENLITPHPSVYIMGTFFLSIGSGAPPFIDLTRVIIDTGNIASSLSQTTVFSIENNFKNIGIGTYSNIYEVLSNGTNIEGKIYIATDDYNFNVFISLQNQIHNITNNYVVEVPLSVQSADVTQQQKTARQLEIMNASLGLVGGLLNIGQGINNIVTGSARAAFGASTGQASQIATANQEIQGGVGQTYQGVTQTAKGIANLVVLNKPLYRTSKGTFSKSIGFVNAYYGLMLFIVNSDNDIEVQANIDNGGYVVNEVVDDLLQDMAVANDKPAYNVMQFDYINNYGAFPEDIRQRLVDILTNGFKIWYNTAEYIAS